MEARVAAIRAARSARAGVAARAPAALHRRHQRRRTPTCSRPAASRCSAPAAAASSPITAPASGWPMSCSTSAGAARTSGASWRRWRTGSSPRSPASTSRGERREDRVGVWVRRPDKGPDREDKIAAIGIRVRRWVTFHGISLNVEPDLAHFSGIVPVRHRRPALRRHQPGRSRPAGDHGRGRHGAEGGVRGGVRGESRRPAFPEPGTASPRRQHRSPVRTASSAGSASLRLGRPGFPTHAAGGPRRHASIIASTSAASPAATASTEPSARLRTQPARPSRTAVRSTK